MKITYTMLGSAVEVYPVGNRDAGMLVQMDWDYPGTAESFGYVLRHKRGCTGHGFTDGTVDCPSCGKTATQFISESHAWLRAHEGRIADDPGYFSES